MLVLIRAHSELIAIIGLFIGANGEKIGRIHISDLINLLNLISRKTLSNSNYHYIRIRFFFLSILTIQIMVTIFFMKSNKLLPIEYTITLVQYFETDGDYPPLSHNSLHTQLPEIFGKIQAHCTPEKRSRRKKSQRKDIESFSLLFTQTHNKCVHVALSDN